MNNVIIVQPDKCTGCNACVRVCPASEANIIKKLDNGRTITEVNAGKCIGCGACIKACKNNARDYKDDTEECIANMESKKFIVLVDPAIKSVFPTKWKGILDWFRRKKGCFIFDVSYGADIYTWATLRAIQQNIISQSAISSVCPSVVKYIENYKPELIKYLSPIQSPVGCEIVFLKKYKKRNNPIVILSPCISKKMETDDISMGDYCITFKKLEEYFERNDIKIPSNSTDDFVYDYDDESGQLGNLFTRSGGLRDVLWAQNPELNIASDAGINSVFPSLNDYLEINVKKMPKIYDVLSCNNGCCGGAGTGDEITTFEIVSGMHKVENDILKKRKGSLISKSDEKMLRKFDDEFTLTDFLRSYKATASPALSDEELDSAFESMGMNSPESRHSDCGMCGYKTCTEMATAIHRNLNFAENCRMCTAVANKNSTNAPAEDSGKNEKLKKNCLGIVGNLKEKTDEITKYLLAYENVNIETAKKLEMIGNLINNIITFCNDHETMDKASVGQLIKILQTTYSGFSGVMENSAENEKSSQSIKECMKNINTLVENINSTLNL